MYGDRVYRFDGKVAIVTGAASGMGRATALAFATAGAAVVAADVAEAAGLETVRLVEAEGGRAHFVRADVSKAGEVEAMVATAADRFGRLDMAVNNAAVEPELVRLVDCDEASFDRQVAVNLKGVFLGMKYAIRQMLEQGGGGAVVNIASVNSFRPQPLQSVYTAVKAGVIGLTKTAAIEYAGDGVRVNAVCPGAIDTPMLRTAVEAHRSDPAQVAKMLSLLGRFGEPAEIAKAVLWLCSEESSFTVGHALAVDGGYLAR
jgi:glucose 1-dehydrogenase